MINKKRTSLLPVGVVSVISKYENYPSLWSSSFICDNNENDFMKGNQQGIILFELTSFWLFVNNPASEWLLLPVKGNKDSQHATMHQDEVVILSEKKVFLWIYNPFVKKMTCTTCKEKYGQVHISGELLEGMDGESIKLLLKRCAVVGPQHVIKKKEHKFAFLHFKTQLDAATFYFYHSHEKIQICMQLGIEEVKPILVTSQVSPTNNEKKPVTYNFSAVQRGLATTTLCKCVHNKEVERQQLLYRLELIQEEKDTIKQRVARLG